MKRRGRWLVLLYVAVAAVIAAAASLPFLQGFPHWAEAWNARRPVSSLRQAHMEKEIVGGAILTAIRETTAGWVVLLHDSFDDPPKVPPSADGTYTMKRILTERVARVPLAPRQLEHLRTILLSEKFYDFETDPNVHRAKMCAPIFRHRLVLTAGSNSLVVNFCFDCDILEFVLDDTISRYVDFKPGEFEQTFRDLFPTDRTLVKPR